MSELARIRVQFDIYRTSPNKTHYANAVWDRRARREHKNASITAGRWAWKIAGRPQAPGPVRVRTIIRRAKEFDADNATAAMKGIRDALFCGTRFADDGGAVTPDDANAWVQFERPEWEIGREWKGREEVVFVVERLEV
jgi:hypothetical protein